jgi:hypothetical protein
MGNNVIFRVVVYFHTCISSWVVITNVKQCACNSLVLWERIKCLYSCPTESFSCAVCTTCLWQETNCVVIACIHCFFFLSGVWANSDFIEGFNSTFKKNFRLFLFLGLCTISSGYSSCAQSYKGNYRICYLYQQHTFPVCWCWWSTFTETEMVPVLWLCHINSLSCFVFWIWPSITGRQVSEVN